MRASLLTLGIVASALAGADAPLDCAVSEVRVCLEGSVWSGTDSDGDLYVFRYLKGGILSYTSPSGTYPKGATWKQDGDAVEMEMNGRYAVYRGVIRGQHIAGLASNVAGHSWTWDVRQTNARGGR